MFFLNVPDIPEGIRFAGLYHPVSNDTQGTGQRIFFNNNYGSDGKLRGALFFLYNTALLNGPSLHELMHSWANYSVPTTVGAHWGFSSANGQLGGFDLEELVDLGGGRYTTTGRGSITMDGLSQFQKAMPTGTMSDRPASFGVLSAPIK